MNPVDLYNEAYTRRQFFRKTGTGLGVAAMASLLSQEGMAAGKPMGNMSIPQFAPKAKRAIYISLIGAPSQLDTFDYKPELKKRFKEDLKTYLAKEGERLTGMTAGQAAFPLAPSIFKFNQHGQSGTWMSELLPWQAKMADDICVIKSMHTDAINHEPANQLICTGSMVNGKASLGSWLSYGLGSMNEDLPSFVVLHAKHTSPFSNVQANDFRTPQTASKSQPQHRPVANTPQAAAIQRFEHGEKILRQNGLFLLRRFGVGVADAGHHRGDMAVLAVQRFAELCVIPREGRESALDGADCVFLAPAGLSRGAVGDVKTNNLGIGRLYRQALPATPARKVLPV